MSGPRTWLALGVAALAAVAFGPAFVGSVMWPTDNPQWRDVVQEWLSARNYFDGQPVYRDQRDTVVEYGVLAGRPSSSLFLRYNAHPPPSVLIHLPLGVLPIGAALLTWNLLSLGCVVLSLALIARGLNVRVEPWMLAVAFALMLACNPLRQQNNQGQINGVLLLLIVGAWALTRDPMRSGSRSQVVAGALLGAATALKMFPGLLLVYFALRRRWWVVLGGTAGFVGLHLASLAVLGAEAYRDYLQQVTPQMGQFRDWWLNASLWGFWSRLFDVRSGHVTPLADSPSLFAVGVALSVVSVLAVWLWSSLRARTVEETDAAFGRTVVAMLLLSPLVWDHYLVLLALPLALLWDRHGMLGRWRPLLWATTAVLWVNMVPVWELFIGREDGAVVAPAWASLTLLALPCAALAALFILLGRRVTASVVA